MKLTLHRAPKIITPNSQEYRNLDKIKWLNLSMLIFIFAIFIGSMWFVYINIYQTIGKVQILITTNANLNFEPIDFKLYNDTVAMWKTRTDLPALTLTRDPFHEMVSPTSTIETKSTTVLPTSAQGQL